MLVAFLNHRYCVEASERTENQHFRIQTDKKTPKPYSLSYLYHPIHNFLFGLFWAEAFLKDFSTLVYFSVAASTKSRR